MSHQVVESDDSLFSEFRAIATRWQGGYEIQVVGVGVTQTQGDSPEMVEEMARYYVSLMLDVQEDCFSTKIEYDDNR